MEALNGDFAYTDIIVASKIHIANLPKQFPTSNCCITNKNTLSGAPSIRFCKMPSTNPNRIIPTVSAICLVNEILSWGFLTCSRNGFIFNTSKLDLFAFTKYSNHQPSCRNELHYEEKTIDKSLSKIKGTISQKDKSKACCSQTGNQCKDTI